jgi:hypothetical protein
MVRALVAQAVSPAFGAVEDLFQQPAKSQPANPDEWRKAQNRHRYEATHIRSHSLRGKVEWKGDLKAMRTDR